MQNSIGGLRIIDDAHTAALLYLVDEPFAHGICSPSIAQRVDENRGNIAHPFCRLGSCETRDWQKKSEQQRKLT